MVTSFDGIEASRAMKYLNCVAVSLYRTVAKQRIMIMQNDTKKK